MGEASKPYHDCVSLGIDLARHALDSFLSGGALAP